MAHIVGLPADATGIPSVAPNPEPPRDYENIQSNPRQFGAQIGEGEQAFGAGALKAGAFFGQVAADEQTNFLLDGMDKILYGDPNDPTKKGFHSLQGKEALDAYPQVVASIQKLRQQGRNNLVTPEQQTEFDRQTRSLYSRELNLAGLHNDSQTRTWAKGVADGQADQSLRGIERSALAGDQDAVDNHTHDFLDARIKAAQNIYGQDLPPEIYNDVLAKGRADSATQQVRAIARTDPMRAQQVLEQNKDALLGGPYDTLKREVDGLATRSEGHSIAQRVLGNSSAAPGGGGALSPLPQAPEQSAPLINKAAGQYGVPEELLTRLLSAENGFRPTGVSSAGARGIAQFIPETASRYGINPDDPTQAIPAAAHYLSDLKKETGTWNGAVRGYLGGDPHKDASYMRAGVPALIDTLDQGGQPPAPTPVVAQPTGARTVGIAAAAAPAQQPGTGKFDMAAGDSIGVGHIRAAKLGGIAVDDVKMPEAATADAAGSRNPQQGLDFIKAHPERFQGKSVLWSSGLMNAQAELAKDPAAVLAKIGEQLDALTATGATVVLAGVDQGKFAQYNTALDAIAAEKGVPFAGPLPTKSVHPGPQGYRDYAAAAAKLLPVAATAADQLQGQPAPAAAPAVTPIPPAVSTPLPGAPPIVPGSAKERSLASMYDQIYDGPGSDDAKEHAWREVKEKYNAMEADYARQQRNFEHAEKLAMEAREQDIWKDVYSPNPTITAQMVATDPAFAGSNERRNQMIALINNPPGSAIPPAQSYQAALSLLDRIRRPEGDPQKITDVGPLYDAAVNGKLNKSDFEFVKKEFDNIRTEGGEQFKQAKADFIKRAAPLITKSNLLQGKADPEGDAQLYNFERALEQKIGEYRKAGKDPSSLITPGSPDFLGRPEAMMPFQTTFQESLQSKSKAITAVPSWPMPAPPIPPAPPATQTVPQGSQMPRKPGETVVDYLKRIGMLPGAPTPAAPAPAPPLAR